MITQESKILITGANGLVGSALSEELKKQGYLNLFQLTRKQCDLTNRDAVASLFLEVEPDVVFHTAATVFGIGGNLKNRGPIFFNNILINTHVIEACRLAKVKKIIAMGTIAAYPDPKVTPVREEHIWDGLPHGSESSYGHAKRAMLAHLLAYKESYGLDFAYVISTNLFGPNDKFNSELGHVIPSLILKFYEAKKTNTNVDIWGDGTASRDFLYSHDMAKALILIMNRFSGSINVASGRETMIKEAVQILTDYFEMQGRVNWNTSMPNGRRFYNLDLTHLNTIGFAPSYSFDEALIQTLDWFVSDYTHSSIQSQRALQ